jgi:hypothetical protein
VVPATLRDKERGRGGDVGYHQHSR